MTTRANRPMNDTPAPPPAKRAKPQPSPEFAQARLRRDIRVLDERRMKLAKANNAKMLAIDTERQRLTAELAAVTARLDPGTNGAEKGGAG